MPAAVPKSPKPSAPKRAAPKRGSKAGPEKAVSAKTAPLKTAGKPAVKPTAPPKAPTKGKQAKVPAAKRASAKQTPISMPPKSATKVRMPKPSQPSHPVAPASADSVGGAAEGGVSVDIPSPAEVLGHVSWLMMRSEAHRHVFVSDFEWLLVPSITLKQFRIYLKEETPFAFATWARLTAEAEARLVAGHRRLSPADWNGGDRLWLIDLIAPFGGMEGILRDLSEKVFPGTPFKALVPGDGGKGLRVMTVCGAASTGGATGGPKRSTTKKTSVGKRIAKKAVVKGATNKVAPTKAPAKKNGGAQ